MKDFIIKIVLGYDRLKVRIRTDWLEILAVMLAVLSPILMILEYAGLISL